MKSSRSGLYYLSINSFRVSVVVFTSINTSYFALVRPQVSCIFHSSSHAIIKHLLCIIPPCFIYAPPLSLSHSFTTSWLNHTPRVKHCLGLRQNPHLPQEFLFCAPCPSPEGSHFFREPFLQGSFKDSTWYLNKSQVLPKS